MTWILPTILFAPLASVLAMLLAPAGRVRLIRGLAILGAAVSLAASLVMIFSFDRAAGGFQFAVSMPCVPTLGISFKLAADGISVVMILLTSFAVFAGTLVSWEIDRREKEYYAFLMTLVVGVFGVFMARDLFFLYLFYEMAVIPMYPLIGIWGSTRREYATMKLTLYLTSGAVLALVGLLSVYHLSGAGTFDLDVLETVLADQPLPFAVQKVIFPAILVGFGVLAPMWPFHSWSPLGHAAAPSAVSMLHAGVLMKLGSYAIIRTCLPLLPQAARFWLPWVAALACFNIIYGGLVAMAQKDVKFIIGYSSSSHMGYVLLGIASLNVMSLSGAVLVMFAHGIMTALAFSLVGFFYHQTHDRTVSHLGGFAQKMPFIGTCFVLMAMASSGLPGFANFVSELMVIVGSWERYRLASILAIWGVVITATYYLRTVRGIFFGPLPRRWEKLHDARTPWRRFPYVMLVAVLLVVGFYPRPMVAVIESGVAPIIARVDAAPDPPSGPPGATADTAHAGRGARP